MNHIKFLFVLLIAVFSFSSNTYACSCIQEGDAIERYDIVFKGTVTWSGRDTSGTISGAFSDRRVISHYSVFKISEVYKGALGDDVQIYYIKGDGSSCAFGGHELGAEYIIYASKDNNGYYSVSLCSPKMKVRSLKEYINPHAAPGLARLSKISESIKAIDALIKENPKVLEFHFKKAEILKGIQDFQRLELVYEDALKVATPEKIGGVYEGYGEALYNLGKYKEALDPLQKAGTERSKILYHASLVYTGRKEELDGQKINFSGLDLEDIDFSDMSLSDADFSGAKLTKAIFKNSKLTGANFSDAQLRVDVSGSDFQGANFTNAKIRGAFLDSNFEKADFTKAELDLKEASRSNFKEANFTDAKLYIMEGSAEIAGAEGSDYSNARFIRSNIGGIGKSKTSGADFTGASFYSGRSTSSRNMGLDLSGQKLDDSKLDSSDFSGGSFKDASLRNASFTGSNLNGVDFTDANLTGADFTVSRYSGPTKIQGANFAGAVLQNVKWEGAIFDCQTKFPEGFDTFSARLEAADDTCVKQPPLGYIPYSKERLYKGNINVCNGDYHAACIYGFIISFAVIQETGSYTARRIQTFLEISRSLLDAGEIDLAKMLLYRAYAEHRGIFLYDRPIGAEFYSLLNRAGIKYASFDAENVSHTRRPMSERKSPQRDEALAFLNEGDKEKARQAAIAGLEKISSYPQTDSKMDMLLIYADIFARIDGKLKPELVKELEKEIRFTPYTHFEKQDRGTTEPKDYVVEGERLLSAN